MKIRAPLFRKRSSSKNCWNYKTLPRKSSAEYQWLVKGRHYAVIRLHLYFRSSFFFFATFFIVERFPLFHNSCIKYKYINKRTKIRVRQFSIDCRKSSGQCSSLTSLCDYSRKLVLPSQPITHKTKPWSSAFSRTSCNWPLFTLRSQWLLVLFSLILTSCCNFFGFVQATLN